MLLLMLLLVSTQADPENLADRFAKLALDCVHRQYPNKIGHVLNSDADALTPKELTPCFYGCFDWHSSVHAHWLLVRILRTYPECSFSSQIKEALALSFSNEHIAQEIAYLEAEGRSTFERPYGLAWFLQLMTELHESHDPLLKQWQAILQPLEQVVAARFENWLPKLSHPIRTGEHSQTAFAFGLVLDWCQASKNTNLEQLLINKINAFYLEDREAPLAYEPSGQDFLSPCFAEADLIRRVQDQATFAAWLGRFMPQIPLKSEEKWLELAVVTDPTDGKLAHLDGLNLSRAWMLEGMASGLPKSDPRRIVLEKTAREHGESGLRAVTGAHYEGGHWLGSFAVYYVTKRGLTAN